MSNTQYCLGVMAQEEMSHPPFGLQTFYLKELAEIAPSLGLSIFIFSPENEQNRKSSLIHGYQYQPETRLFIQCVSALPTFIYDRFTAKSFDGKHHLIEFLKFHSIEEYRWLNPPSMAKLLKDKYLFSQFMLENGYPHIQTNILTDKTWQEWVYHSKKTSCYLKPREGSNGKGILHFTKNSNTLDYRTSTEEKQLNLENSEILVSELLSSNPEGSYLLQEEVSLLSYVNASYDLRVLLQNNGKNICITGYGFRIGKEGSPVSNLSAGGMVHTWEEWAQYFSKEVDALDLKKKIFHYCLSFYKAMEKRFGSACEIAFDILINTEGAPIILEANYKPARWIFQMLADHTQGSESAYYLELRHLSVQRPLEYAVTKFNNLQKYE